MIVWLQCASISWGAKSKQTKGDDRYARLDGGGHRKLTWYIWCVEIIQWFLTWSTWWNSLNPNFQLKFKRPAALFLSSWCCRAGGNSSKSVLTSKRGENWRNAAWSLYMICLKSALQTLKDTQQSCRAVWCFTLNESWMEYFITIYNLYDSCFIV